MTNNEQIVFHGATFFLDTFNNPPPASSPLCDTWWEHAAGALNEYVEDCQSHPLAQRLATALYEYLEIKAKGASDHA